MSSHCCNKGNLVRIRGRLQICPLSSNLLIYCLINWFVLFPMKIQDQCEPKVKIIILINNDILIVITVKSISKFLKLTRIARMRNIKSSTSAVVRLPGRLEVQTKLWCHFSVLCCWIANTSRCLDMIFYRH